MEMFGAYVNSQPRPEQIQLGMAGCDIGSVQRLLKLLQHFSESAVIIG